MNKPYVIVYFPETREAYCLDRGYNLMHTGGSEKEVWGQVCMSDIVQVTNDWRIETKEPEWARHLRNRGEKSIAIWTNYYDKWIDGGHDHEQASNTDGD